MFYTFLQTRAVVDYIYVILGNYRYYIIRLLDYKRNGNVITCIKNLTVLVAMLKSLLRVNYFTFCNLITLRYLILYVVNITLFKVTVQLQKPGAAVVRGYEEFWNFHLMCFFCVCFFFSFYFYKTPQVIYCSV